MAPSAPSPQPQATSRRNKRIANPTDESSTLHPPLQSTSADSVPSETQAVTPGRSSVHHRQRNVRLRPPISSHLLRLPVELLHAIATNLCGSKDIINLARVNKHVYRVTQEALIKRLVVSKYRIKWVVELLTRRPHLCAKVSSVDLGDYGCAHVRECCFMPTPNFDRNALKALRKVIAANTGGQVSWNDIRQNKGASGPVWRKNNAFFLDILISLCPNIKSITLELPEARVFDASQPPRPDRLAPSQLPNLNTELLPVLPFHGPALRLMQKNLEVLTIAENTRWKGPAKLEILNHDHDVVWRNMGRHTITLLGFAKLKRLDMPMDLLGLPHTVVFSDLTSDAVAINEATAEDSYNEHDPDVQQALLLAKSLPLTLKFLHLRSCNQYTFALLQRFNEIPVLELNIVYIELFFTTCPRNSIAQCYAADEGKLNYLTILSELAEKGIKVTFYTGPRKTLFDMRKELTALAALSPLEAWCFAQLGRQYSEVNLKASAQRRVSNIGSHLFVKHAPHYFRLMNSPTFNSKCWKDAAFFHGIQNTKWDTNILPHDSKVHTFKSSRWNNMRVRSMREPKRRLKELLGKIPLQKQFKDMLITNNDADISRFSFSFRFEMITSPPPMEVPFLGATIAIPKNPLIAPK